MAGQNRRAGKFTETPGYVLPVEGFTGKPEVYPPDDIGDQARAWWANWATSRYAHFFDVTHWQRLSDCAIMMGHFYETGNPRYFGEVRQHQNLIFGLAINQQLHIGQEQPEENQDSAPATPKVRQDPRLKAV